MVSSRNIYEITLNDEPINISLGPAFVEKLQEPLDEGAINLPLEVYDYEFEMFGILNIRMIGEFKEKMLTYFITSDSVEPESKDGYYNHKLSLIEYTALYDTILVETLTFTKNNKSFRSAPFLVNYERGSVVDSSKATTYDWIPPIKIKEFYEVEDKLELEQTELGYNFFSSTTPYRKNIYLRFYKPSSTKYNEQGYFIVDGTYFQEKILSSGDVSFEFTEDGIWLIEYGMVDFKDDNGATTSRKAFLTFQVQVEKKDNKTLYDYLMRIRNTIPLETRRNHNNTRLFRIKEDLKERFKQVEMPQMFITQMTLRQTLNVLFQFVNSIVKIEYIKDNIDVLDVFEFNKIVGSFEMNDIVDFKTKQDVQQYGTEIVSWLENTIENDFRGNPNMTFPANNFFKTVRANNVQLTNNQNGFCLDLDGATLYDIHKFEVVLPKVTYGPVAPSQTYLAQTVENFELDLTARLINKAEWELKRMTNDFPNYKQEGLWREKVGLRLNRGGNIFWERNSSVIQFSLTLGTWFQKTIIYTTIYEGLAEHFTLNSPLAIGDSGQMETNIGFNIDDLDEETFYRNIGFNIEFTTLKSLQINNHKSDISKVNRYTQVRLNQSSRLVNIDLASKNATGKIERMGIPNKSFSKFHESVDDFLKIGLQDSEGYVITEASYEPYNDYIIGNYEITKDHIRLSEFTQLDRAYRVFDVPKGSDVYDRKDHYEDFLIVDRLDSDLENSEVLYNKDFIKKSVGRLVNNTLEEDKITYGFIKTDGFDELYKPDGNKNKAIMTSVSSFGIEQALVFNFGFNSNIIAGNALYKEDGNVYNEPIRYTNFKGTFELLYFGLGSKYNQTESFPSIGGAKETILNKTYKLPLVQAQGSNMAQDFLVVTGTKFIDTITNPIIYNKDKSEVMKSFTYQVSILPKNYEDYVIGYIYYDKNNLVNNQDTLDTLSLYLYKDNLKYGVFDKDKIKKSNDYVVVPLVRQSGSRNIMYNELTQEVVFIGNAEITEDVTSWAIGNQNEDLYIACNINQNGFKLLSKHFRPNINYNISSIDLFGSAKDTIEVFKEKWQGHASDDGGGSINQENGYEIVITGHGTSDFGSVETVALTDFVENIVGFPSDDEAGSVNIEQNYEIEVLGNSSDDFGGLIQESMDLFAETIIGNASDDTAGSVAIETTYEIEISGNASDDTGGSTEITFGSEITVSGTSEEDIGAEVDLSFDFDIEVLASFVEIVTGTEWQSITSTQYNALSSKGTYERNGNIMNVCPTISVGNLPDASNYVLNFGMKLIATKLTPLGNVECDVMYFKAI